MFRNLLPALALVAYANAHALMSEPPQRGILAGSSKFTPGLEIIDGAPRDFFGHFPAGDKSTRPGAGKLSQEIEGNWKWSMYDPLKPGFKFRAGVCGDLKSKPEHLRGGRYYFGGRITRTYQQGGVFEVRQAVVAHHNGFTQLHVCDVQKCGGEISERCFRAGHCYPVERASNPICDNGMSKKCAPIDKNYPTRWYLPCTEQINDEGWDDYLGKYALFKLPDFLTCDHCVLQWFYTSANNCNPPGVIEFFKGPNGPKNWGRCKGQAGAIGGFTQVQNNCGEGPVKDQFPEEYYQCADIKIEASGARSPSTRPPETAAPTTRAPTTRAPTTRAPTTRAPTTRAPTTRAPTTRAPRPTRPSTRRPTTAATPPPEPVMDNSSGLFEYFNFVADGEVVRSFTTSLRINIRRYKKVAIEVVASRQVRPVAFYIDGVKVWDENTGPYFLYGNSGRNPRYFNRERLNAVLNRSFKLEVRWRDERLAATIRMIR